MLNMGKSKSVVIGHELRLQVSVHHEASERCWSSVCTVTTKQQDLLYSGGRKQAASLLRSDLFRGGDVLCRFCFFLINLWIAQTMFKLLLSCKKILSMTSAL